MAFDLNNVFSNQHARHGLIGVITILVFWLLARLVSGFGDVFRRRTPVAANTAPVGTNVNPTNPYAATTPAVGTTAVGTRGRGLYDDAAHQTSKALRDLFIWLFAAWVINYLINGFNRSLAIFFLFTVALGLIWALLRKPLHKFADILLLLLIPLILALFIIPVVDVGFLRTN